MHPERKKRILGELKDATPLTLTVRFDIEIGGGIITNTLVLNEMPALFFKSDGKFVIKCLPLNHLGMGKTKREAFENFGEDLAEMLTETLTESSFLDHLRILFEGTAAPLYWIGRI